MGKLDTDASDLLQISPPRSGDMDLKKIKKEEYTGSHEIPIFSKLYLAEMIGEALRETRHIAFKKTRQDQEDNHNPFSHEGPTPSLRRSRSLYGPQACLGFSLVFAGIDLAARKLIINIAMKLNDNLKLQSRVRTSIPVTGRIFVESLVAGTLSKDKKRIKPAVWSNGLWKRPAPKYIGPACRPNWLQRDLRMVGDAILGNPQQSKSANSFRLVDLATPLAFYVCSRYPPATLNCMWGFRFSKPTSLCRAEHCTDTAYTVDEHYRTEMLEIAPWPQADSMFGFNARHVSMAVAGRHWDKTLEIGILNENGFVGSRQLNPSERRKLGRRMLGFAETNASPITTTKYANQSCLLMARQRLDVAFERTRWYRFSVLEPSCLVWSGGDVDHNPMSKWSDTRELDWGNGCQPGNTNPKPMETAASSHATTIKLPLCGGTHQARLGFLCSPVPRSSIPSGLSKGADSRTETEYLTQYLAECLVASFSAGRQDSEVRNHSACTIDKPCRILPRPHRSRACYPYMACFRSSPEESSSHPGEAGNASGFAVIAANSAACLARPATDHWIPGSPHRVTLNGYQVGKYNGDNCSSVASCEMRLSSPYQTVPLPSGASPGTLAVLLPQSSSQSTVATDSLFTRPSASGVAVSQRDGSPNTSAWEAGIHPMGLRLCDTMYTGPAAYAKKRGGSAAQLHSSVSDALPKGGCFQYTTGATGRWIRRPRTPTPVPTVFPDLRLHTGTKTLSMATLASIGPASAQVISAKRRLALIPDSAGSAFNGLYAGELSGLKTSATTQGIMGWDGVRGGWGRRIPNPEAPSLLLSLASSLKGASLRRGQPAFGDFAPLSLRDLVALTFYCDTVINGKYIMTASRLRTIQLYTELLTDHEHQLCPPMPNFTVALGYRLLGRSIRRTLAGQIRVDSRG
ncbi:uncharacterized protein CLUP02_01384 [Colletotrichum lupini]|uniref:Uncharacterized protein n=1 Tax=Colletotrichum lupini TaxID=145971 RepID=A0A9Q8SDW2_9PEZI|nr:uncharacterized protein CLUP02_01384 [Colletotrichum lupini]UQC74732.1 hypothetical protein CLUP02_01384 [Colletotrichum lupini]